jgi:hypothetical protein
MTGLTVGIALAIAYLLIEIGCRERPLPRQLDWWQLQALGQLGHSKKQRGRGEVNHAGLSRREQTHRG